MSLPIASIPDHFEALGFPREYDIEPRALRERYLQLARGVHPDAVGGADAGRRSAALNEAKRILSDPVLRAEHLLALAGGQDASMNRAVPPEILSATLELREQLESGAGAGATESIREMVQHEHDARLEQIARLARQLPGDTAVRDALRMELNSLRYQQRLLEHIEGGQVL